MTASIAHQVYCQESFKWYMLGQVALNEFRRHVQDRCKSVVSKHLPALAEAIGTDEAQLQPPLDYPTPGDTTRTGREAWSVEVGARVTYKGTVVFSAHVWWGSERWKKETGAWEQHPHGVQVWVWSKQKSDTDAFRRTAQRARSSRWESWQADDRTIYRWCEMPLAKMPQFDKELDALVADTIRLIKKSGAFRKRKP